MLGTEKETERCGTFHPSAVGAAIHVVCWWVFTYSMARGGQGRPVRRWVERLLDFSSDDPVE